jgi:hypothetical protein
MLSILSIYYQKTSIKELEDRIKSVEEEKTQIMKEKTSLEERLSLC